MFREFVDVLEEYQFDTFSLVGDLNDEAIAAPKGVFVGDVYAGDHHVDTLIVKGGKAGSGHQLFHRRICRCHQPGAGSGNHRDPPRDRKLHRRARRGRRKMRDVHASDLQPESIPAARESREASWINSTSYIFPTPC